MQYIKALRYRSSTAVNLYIKHQNAISVTLSMAWSTQNAKCRNKKTTQTIQTFCEWKWLIDNGQRRIAKLAEGDRKATVA